MSDPLYCKDCRFSEYRPEQHDMRCFHPRVNARDVWALTSEKGRGGGSSCRGEREKEGWWWVPCGMTGKLWESARAWGKAVPEQDAP